MTSHDYDTPRQRGTEKTYQMFLGASVPLCVVTGVRRIATTILVVLLFAAPARADDIKVMTSGAFTEAYQQFDLNVGYDFNDHLSMTFEAINLTGEDIRIHGRSELQLFRLEDQFARYAIGARYKF